MHVCLFVGSGPAQAVIAIRPRTVTHRHVGDLTSDGCHTVTGSAAMPYPPRLRLNSPRRQDAPFARGVPRRDWRQIDRKRPE